MLYCFELYLKKSMEVKVKDLIIQQNEIKDSKKNKAPVFATLGASSHSNCERELNDYYATEPFAMELLLNEEKFSYKIWECACGEGHLAKVLEKKGYEVIATDLIYRGYGNEKPLDFLEESIVNFDGDIITNPPYKYALDFVKKALKCINVGNKVAMFLKLQFLEGKERKIFFMENPPKIVYVSSSRLNCVRNGEFDKYPSSAVAYAWFVWEKGFKGDSIIKWIN